MCAPFSTFRAFVSSFECTSLRFHSTAAAKVGGMKTSIKKRRTRKKKDHPEDIFVLLEDLWEEVFALPGGGGPDKVKGRESAREKSLANYANKQIENCR